MKQLLLKGGDWTLNEGLNQAMKMKAFKTAAEAPARLQGLTGALARASQLSDRRREGQRVCWQCGSAGHLRRDRWGVSREEDKDSGNE